VNIYHQVTGQRKSRLKALMNEEKWITAQEAKEWGFVDKITKSKVLNKTDVMNEDLMKLLKVENEVDLLKTVNKLIEESEAKDTTIAELENKVKDFEVAAKQTEAEMINEFLDNAVKEGKIKEAAKEKWFAQAEKDFGLVKETITSIETIEAGIENFIEATVGDDVKLTPKEKFYKNWREGKYEKDPEAYAKDYSAAFEE
jgi:enoyl-CoA hydratase/carnithine racemase